MKIESLPERIESALKQATDFKSFAQSLLRDCLRWPIDRNAAKPEEIGYLWSADELSAPEMEQKLTAREILLAPRSEQPYGIFLLEFKESRVFETRGFTTPLRKILRGLVASRRKDSNLRSWAFDRILFICTYDYKQFVFAHFWDPFSSGKVNEARLASFGWQPTVACRTVVEVNLPHLVWPDEPEGWKEWHRAFDKEPLTKRFFQKFDDVLELIKDDLEKRGHLKSAEAYSKAQLLLERLIFLYFIQKRGWLNQEPDFLFSNLQSFRARRDDCSYYSEFLEKVFWSLSTPHSEGKYLSRFSGLPFLNGGLFDDDEFDPAPVRKSRNPPMQVRNSTFGHVFDDLLQTFNFTVREDTPLNQEVAVDPEMLGKVFESIVLHAESADRDAIAPDKRKQTGSYYTARIVVHFNCREVLYQYLLPRMSAFSSPSPLSGRGEGEGDWGTKLRRLLELDASDGLSSEGIAVLRECLTPEQGSFLLELLKKLRCCDPAVGSGAFMVGLLHELTNLRRLAQAAANGYVDPLRKQGSTWLHETKADIIQNCLFGVDIQQQAIEICMLRLWLSLVVDYDLGLEPFIASRSEFLKALTAISQLPNLEMNFKRGDSLHDHICGVPVVILPGKEHRYQNDFDAVHRLGAKLHNAKSSEYKRKLRVLILERRLEVSTRVLDDELANLRRDGLPSVDLFGESSSEAEKRRRLAHEMGQLEAARRKTEQSQRDLAALASKPFDAKFQQRLRKLEGADFDSPFNLAWRIDFPQVFYPEKSAGADADSIPRLGAGFDIIVGNPPFVTARNPVKREIWRRRWPAVCKGTYHLLSPFIECAFELLKPKGFLGFIVSNAFAKRETGAPLVEYLSRHQAITKLIDCSGLSFPGHGTPTCLLFGFRSPPREGELIRNVATLPGGGDLRTVPEESPLWFSIERNHAANELRTAALTIPEQNRGYRNVYEDNWIAVGDCEPKRLLAHPCNFVHPEWPTFRILTSSHVVKLADLTACSIGFNFMTHQDEVYAQRPDLLRRASVEMQYVRQSLPGQFVRNYSMTDDEYLIVPYSPTWELLPEQDDNAFSFLRWFRRDLQSRATFDGGTYGSKKIPWYQFHQVDRTKSNADHITVGPEIATHTHFEALGNDRVWPQTNQVILLSGGDRETRNSIVVAILNSSAGMFVLKQTCFNKASGGDEERDRYVFSGKKLEQLPVPDKLASALRGEGNELATALAVLAGQCLQRGQVLPSLALKKLFEKPGEGYQEWNSTLPGHAQPHKAVGAPFTSAEEMLQALRRAVAERERLRSEMIALQEEMDWLVYVAYGLLPEDSPALLPFTTTLKGNTGIEPLDKDLRPYRLWQKAEGDFDKAAAMILPDWSDSRKQLWTERLTLIRDNEHIRRIEQPVYKRRWDEQWKVKNRWECGEIAYRAELRDAFDWWLREKAEWWLEHKAENQQASLHNWAKALWKDARVQAAVEAVIGSMKPETTGDLGVPEVVPRAFERLLKEVVDEETVPAGIPFAKPWEELEKKKLAGLPKARKIRGKLNVPRERFHLVAKDVYSWAGKLFVEQ